MADARSLLKAKRLERGAASVPTRTALGGLREDERLRKGKRKLENTTAGAVDVIPPTSPVAEPPSDKRRRVGDPEIETESAPANVGFPSGFFSDPSRRLPIADDDHDGADDEEPLSRAPTSPPSQPPPNPPQPMTPSIDDEF